MIINIIMTMKRIIGTLRLLFINNTFGRLLKLLFWLIERVVSGKYKA